MRPFVTREYRSLTPLDRISAAPWIVVFVDTQRYCLPTGLTGHSSSMCLTHACHKALFALTAQDLRDFSIRSIDTSKAVDRSMASAALNGLVNSSLRRSDRSESDHVRHSFQKAGKLG